MGYMFNKQLRGYNTEEVDDTIETLEKKIQETTLQIRRLEKELEVNVGLRVEPTES